MGPGTEEEFESPEREGWGPAKWGENNGTHVQIEAGSHEGEEVVVLRDLGRTPFPENNLNQIVSSRPSGWPRVAWTAVTSGLSPRGQGLAGLRAGRQLATRAPCGDFTDKDVCLCSLSNHNLHGGRVG